MSQDQLRDQLDELRGALSKIEEHLESQTDHDEALQDFRNIVDGTRRSVWTVLQASNGDDYDGFVAGFRLRRATDLYQSVLQHLQAGHITIGTDGIEELRNGLEEVTETLGQVPRARPSAAITRETPAVSEPDLHADVQHLRQSLDLIEEQMSAESMPARAYEDFKVAIDNVRTSVLAMLFATRAKSYSSTIGQFHLNRATAISKQVLSDLVLGIVGPESEDYDEFKSVAYAAFEKLDLICGGGLRRLSMQQPAPFVP